MTVPSEILTFTVAPEHAGQRLDKWLAIQADGLSRSRIQQLIGEGRVQLDGATASDLKYKVRAGETCSVDLPPPVDPTPLPEDIPLSVLFEDEHLIIIDKPAGMVVHPAPGAESGTLVNALLHHCGDSLSGINGVARPGIVHRLDKDTSGVMVAAKSEIAHNGLAALFEVHMIDRVYLAVTRGAPRPLLGTIDTRIGRSDADRKKMAVIKERPIRIQEGYEEEESEFAPNRKGRQAITHYKVIKQFGKTDTGSGLAAATLTECRLETGRTHQIRVHMAHIGATLIGDPTYGKGRGLRAQGSGPVFDADMETIRGFRRQALHAAVLGFEHPVTGENLRFETPPPADMQALLDALGRLPS